MPRLHYCYGTNGSFQLLSGVVVTLDDQCMSQSLADEAVVGMDQVPGWKIIGDDPAVTAPDVPVKRGRPTAASQSLPV